MSYMQWLPKRALVLFGVVGLTGVFPFLMSRAPAVATEDALSWAYLNPDSLQPARDESVVRSVSGSAKLYSLRQIESLTDPPDWFPEDHAPMPQIVARGRAEGVFACASCHLTSGRGTPASADLAGLP